MSLVRSDRRIAFEISITTGNDQELSNVEKCLAAGYSDVVLVGSNLRHVKALSKFIEENLEEGTHGKVKYLAPEQIIEYLDSLGGIESKEEVVRGYRVRTIQQLSDPSQAEARRKAIAGVIARSLSQKTKD